MKRKPTFSYARTDDANIHRVEGKRDVAEERAKHEWPVSLADEIGLADKQVHADRLLAEREGARVVGVIADPVVLEHSRGDSVEQGDVVIGRIFPAQGGTVAFDHGVRIRKLDAVVPPAADVRLEQPTPYEVEVAFAERRERVTRRTGRCRGA